MLQMAAVKPVWAQEEEFKPQLRDNPDLRLHGFIRTLLTHSQPQVKRRVQGRQHTTCWLCVLTVRLEQKRTTLFCTDWRRELRVVERVFGVIMAQVVVAVSTSCETEGRDGNNSWVGNLWTFASLNTSTWQLLRSLLTLTSLIKSHKSYLQIFDYYY